MPYLPPGDLLNPEIKLRSPAVQADSLPSEPPEKPRNTGVGSLSLLQGIPLTQESNRGLLHFRQILYQLSHLGVPSPAVLMVNSAYTARSCWESDLASSMVCTLAAKWRHIGQRGPWRPSQATPALPPRPYCRCPQPRSPITRLELSRRLFPTSQGVGWGPVTEEEGGVATEVEVGGQRADARHGRVPAAVWQDAWKPRRSFGAGSVGQRAGQSLP